MREGRIIFLNGVTSTGKTSIVNEIFTREGELYYALSYDLFEETIPEWAVDEGTHYSEAIIAMYYAACGFSSQGRDVLIDGLIMNLPGLEEHYKKLKQIFEGYPLQIVEVYCPLEICRKRNIECGDRAENKSEIQMEIMEKNITYNYTIDTSRLSVAECADLILKFCD
ncbi:chloramphenicol phosphotransferase CPT family protein [Lachnoclostridium phytofermentans]|uniref:Chloramphenicol 3-O-phosphotransferase-like protein n=1 Tax=Lachnoclostridium phytofermentans (strain ATCC 700394 / DSM 18823 / ISDg) TaxID=357809 RepID=A9KJF3_LACP7|nr:chemotaxis protein [Lachnoclostridium phytofermentans]ABX43973.1 Chloramphenicol 3-O-phosphotransferase-like protein [Lachnoclostridium phytofermentans ISDg]